jgi:hypothetical protein
MAYPEDPIGGYLLGNLRDHIAKEFLADFIPGNEDDKTPTKDKTPDAPPGTVGRVSPCGFASRSDGVPRTSKTLLGSPFLGEGLLLHHQRQHHRRGDTSVSQVS